MFTTIYGNGEKEKKKTLKSVNWHCFKACNYACEFCYARFAELMTAPFMAENEGYKLLDQLADAGVEKVNFVGGEPMLHPHIEAWIIYAKKLDMVTSIVSNGTNIDEDFLDRIASSLDWVGLSVDASNDKLHAKLGRGLRKEISRGISNHLIRSLAIAKLLQNYDVGIKLNTVVTSLNCNDDMTSIVKQINPDRWKIFQVLGIEGENDDEIEKLSIDESTFEAYVDYHKQQLQNLPEITIIGEDNDVMLGSYAMIDPIGRVYTNKNGGYKYSENTALELGFQEAWNQVSCGFDENRFYQRNGDWDWNRETIGGEA